MFIVSLQFFLTKINHLLSADAVQLTKYKLIKYRHTMSYITSNILIPSFLSSFLFASFSILWRSSNGTRSAPQNSLGDANLTTNP